MCCNYQDRVCFSEMIDLISHMPRFTWKMNVFPSICIGNCINGCWNSQNRARFSKTINLRGHMPRFTLKNERFPFYLIRITRNVCWNHQNRACFSKTIDLRGQMPRFTWKMNVFPSIFLERPEMCVVTIRTGFIFLRWSIWSVTCLGWPEKWMFSHLSTWKPHKYVLKPSEQGSFFQDNQFEGSHA